MQAGIHAKTIYTMFGKGSTAFAAHLQFFLWANIANAWLPIQTYGETSVP
jgi:hypothetical protein